MTHYLLLQICQIVELIMYCYLGFRVIHLASFQHKTHFWKDKKNGTAIALIAVSSSFHIQSVITTRKPNKAEKNTPIS